MATAIRGRARQIRTRRGLTTGAWAAEAGVCPRLARDFENGRDARIGTVEKLMDALDSSLCVASRSELASAEAALTRAEGYLDQLDRTCTSLERFLLNAGSPAKTVPQGQIAAARAGVRSVLRFLRWLRENDVDS